MAQYRLRSAHYMPGDKWLPGDVENENILGPEKGTIVGDGTPHVVNWPTLEMEPLDDEASAMIAKEMKRLEINSATMKPVENLSMHMDQYEKNYIPGLNTRRKEAQPHGAPMEAPAKR